MPRVTFTLLWLLALAVPASAQGDAGSVERLLARLERVLDEGDREGFRALFTVPADPDVARYANHLFTPAAQVVVRERERRLLPDVPADQGQQIVIDVFASREATARLVTAGLELRQGSDEAGWRIAAIDGIAALDTLHRLRLDTTRAFDARAFELESGDLRLRMQSGTVFLVECDAGITGLVLAGRGQMDFAPQPESERSQLRLFSGSEALRADFESAFVRMSPLDIGSHVPVLSSFEPAARDVRLAEEVFSREAPRSFGVELGDLADETWHLLPPPGDVVAEIRTRRHGTLTYVRAAAQMEDVTLFQRDRRTIALYASESQLDASDPPEADEATRDYEVLDYDVEATIDPSREQIDARAALRLRVRSSGLSRITLRLADPLFVSSVSSVEHGRLLHVRIRDQHTILVALPDGVSAGADLTLVVDYAGRLASQEIASDGPPPETPDGINFAQPLRLEPHYLLTGNSYWYPQPAVPGHTPATLRITVPDGYRCVGTGEPIVPERATLGEWLALAGGNTFVFRARAPIRYLAVVVSRFVRAAETTVSLNAGRDAPPLRIAVETPGGLRSRGRALLDPIERIVRFYAGLMGDPPYPTLTLALLESELPGGHSPGYFVAIKEPVVRAVRSWRTDPAAFDNVPDFVLAHETAHQWWGQAIGWRNYHEQWISEGFAQYLAAMYAQASGDDRLFADILRQFRRTALSQSDQGPVSLGPRVGHIRADGRAHRAIVYNKGAAVLHMLRRLVGDTVFSNALRAFYGEWKFRSAGTEDLRHAFEAASGLDLARFFDGWIRDTHIPRVRYSTQVEGDNVTLRFEQQGDRVFDIPVTVSLVYRDGRIEDTVMRIDEATVERHLRATGAVRRVDINRDSAALAEFSR